MQYYRLIKDCTNVGVDVPIGSTCYQITFNGDDMNIYHFPIVDNKFYLKGKDLKEISKEEYMKNIWSKEN